MINKTILLMLGLSFLLILSAGASPAFSAEKEYSLWYDRPAFNRGSNAGTVVARGFPYDEDWERWSLPIGNGHMGACIFGRTDVERIQLSEKTMANEGCYRKGGFTNFAEIYLDIHHGSASDYKRALRLNDAVSTVEYRHNGVRYSREYFANCPHNVIAVKLKADQAGQVSFRLRPVLPYLKPFSEEQTGRSGQVVAEADLITLSGEVQFFHLAYECQIKVKPYGGRLRAEQDALTGNGTIVVQQADSVELLIAAATSYALNEKVFLLPPAEKCAGNEHPHRRLSERIHAAAAMGYEALKREHVADYRSFFGRVQLQLTDKVPSIPTHQLLYQYRRGQYAAYLEELYFQYGRYLLIASSRDGALPPNLQGGWTQYDYSPWSGGYWHNINIQMNYWPVFNTNLTELFRPFADYNEAYRKAGMRNAKDYLEQTHPEAVDALHPENNGWTIGTGASAYNVDAPGGHSGPGTGGFTTKLFWDYYDFTRDLDILQQHTYPALEGMARFLSKTLKPDADGKLLADPSFSPEQYHQGKPYQTIGCTFDQGMIWENSKDLLEAARLLHRKNRFLKQVEQEMQRLDPIQIGEDGQLKEYREEQHYGDFGDPLHRHISHLCTLYPGTMVNSSTPEWMQAARISLEKRTARPIYNKGWPLAHQMNVWARLKDGNRAWDSYRKLLSEGVLDNLWGLCPPFQIDSNLGGTAGVAEMLLQSHEGYLEPLPALPDNWKDGSYSGLLARGNFEVSVQWKEKQVTRMSILSRKGSLCRIRYAGIARARITDGKQGAVRPNILGEDLIELKTKEGETYQFSFFD